MFVIENNGTTTSCMDMLGIIVYLVDNSCTLLEPFIRAEELVGFKVKWYFETIFHNVVEELNFSK